MLAFHQNHTKVHALYSLPHPMLESIQKQKRIANFARHRIWLLIHLFGVGTIYFPSSGP
jgi:hypothetical protein